MHIIKLNAIDSTNSYLRRMGMDSDIQDYTAVMAAYQTEGRGQMGTVWESDSHRNLIISIYKEVGFLRVDDNFDISMVVSISVIEALKELLIRNLSIKWPNDILADSFKIGGILIENIIKNQHIVGSIIGIGINVNQTSFHLLPKASSLRLISGQYLNTEELAHSIIAMLKRYFNLLRDGERDYIKSRYVKKLFRINKPSTFKDREGNLFSGYISGISDRGKLQVLVEDQITKEYDLKEISLMY